MASSFWSDKESCHASRWKAPWALFALNVSWQVGTAKISGRRFVLQSDPEPPHGSTTARIQAAAAVSRTPDHGVEHRLSASDAGLDENGVRRAVSSARAAFHTGVSIRKARFAVFPDKDTVRAYDGAKAAAHAFFGIPLKGHHIL
jgi:hypothetical protein